MLIKSSWLNSGLEVGSLIILLYFFCNTWLPKIPSDQFYCLLLFSMTSYWCIMMQPDNFCSQFIVFWHIHFSFLVHYTINFPLFLISQHLYSCLLYFFYGFYHFIIFYFLLSNFLQQIYSIYYNFYHLCFSHL